jgi:hypothetical protein
VGNEFSVRVVLKHDRSVVLSFRVGFESQPLLNGVFRIGESDEGKIAQHQVSFNARVGFIQELKAFRILLPFSYLNRFHNRLSVDPDEPEFVGVVIDIDCLFLALPHCSEFKIGL